MVALPVFDVEACSLGRLACAECEACVTACPTGALTADADGLALEAATCTACGACAAICPQRAVTLDALLPLPPFAADRSGEALVVCPRHPAEGPLCLQSLGLETLAALWLGGVRRVVLAVGDCAACPSGAGLDLSGRLEQLNALLSDRGRAPVTTREASRTDLRRLPQLASPQDRPDPRRRAFFGGIGDRIVGERAPSALARVQSLPPTSAAPRFAHAPRISAAACSGCNACVNVCPEAALSLINATGPDPAYVCASALCTGCLLCEQVCEEEAIIVLRDAAAMPDVKLESFRCRSCGVTGHGPAGTLRADGLCPVCAKVRHSSKLFQIIE